jgi:hypothetical protein
MRRPNAAMLFYLKPPVKIFMSQPEEISGDRPNPITT